MSVELSGNSPAALTAGILLLSRARQFGTRLQVSVLGDPSEITPVRGPALVHSAVLASCGVGRRPDGGAAVIVPGPAEDPLAVSLSPEGLGPWFTVDRRGVGEHPATQATVRMCRSADPEARRLGRELLQALRGLGCIPEPAVLDLALQAPVSAYHRVAVGLRAGRALHGRTHAPVHTFLEVRQDTLADVVQSPCALADLQAAAADGRLDMLLSRLGPSVRAATTSWTHAMLRRAPTDPDAATLVAAVLETIAPVVTLPSPVVLPAVHPAADSVACALPTAIGAMPTGNDDDAARGLVETFQFLGGRFVSTARFPVVVPGDPAPKARLDRWKWFCTSARSAADTADALWRRVVDPVQ